MSERIVPDSMDTMVWLRSENPMDWPRHALSKVSTILGFERERFLTVGSLRSASEWEIGLLPNMGKVSVSALRQRLDQTHPGNVPPPPAIDEALSKIASIRQQLDEVEAVLISLGREVKR